MAQLSETKTFNQRQRVVEGWYWALRSKDLARGKVKPLSFLGRELAVYRGGDGKVHALDAYCPHMGAHLAEGRVEGNALRCFFHHWKFDAEGRCVDIPCQRQTDFVPKLAFWPTEEKYGLIWIWAGKTPSLPIPEVYECAGQRMDSRIGRPFKKDCHPNVMMINAIDAQHFNSVHHLPLKLDFKVTDVDRARIHFSNQEKIPGKSMLTRFFARFYAGPLRYILYYWFGSTGTVTIGPDFLHFHIIFALRPTEDGRSEGQTILLTKHRPGFWGRLINPILLLATQWVGNYFAHGDTMVFKTIRFKFRTPVKSDHSVIRFVQHLESQKTYSWGLPEVIAEAPKASAPQPFGGVAEASL